MVVATMITKNNSNNNGNANKYASLLVAFVFSLFFSRNSSFELSSACFVSAVTSTNTIATTKRASLPPSRPLPLFAETNSTRRSSVINTNDRYGDENVRRAGLEPRLEKMYSPLESKEALMNALNVYLEKLISLHEDRGIPVYNNSDGFNNSENILHEMLANLDVSQKYGYPISTWDVSILTDFSFLFRKYGKCLDNENSQNNATITWQEDLSGWDVSRVTNMNGMLQDSTCFNPHIAVWDVSSVREMQDMFLNASAFDHDLATWNVASVTNMRQMFAEAKAFNGDLAAWNTSKVITMSEMFRNATTFNRDLSAWDVSNVDSMEYMFMGATSFQQDLCDWGLLLRHGYENDDNNKVGKDENNNAFITDMFRGTACPQEDKEPIFPRDQVPGPFCFVCHEGGEGKHSSSSEKKKQSRFQSMSTGQRVATILGGIVAGFIFLILLVMLALYAYQWCCYDYGAYSLSEDGGNSTWQAVPFDEQQQYNGDNHAGDEENHGHYEDEYGRDNAYGGDINGGLELTRRSNDSAHELALTENDDCLPKIS